MSATGQVIIPIDDSFAGSVCDFGIGFLKLKYKEGDSPVAGTGTFARLGRISGIITAGHVLQNLPHDKVGLVRLPRVQPGLQKFELDMAKTDNIVEWNKRDGDAPDIGFLRIPELDTRELEAKGAVFRMGESNLAPVNPHLRGARSAVATV